MSLNHRSAILVCALLALVVAGWVGAAQSRSTAPAARVTSLPPRADLAAEAFGRLPLSFVENAGQAAPEVKFFAQTSGASFSFTTTQAVFSFAGPALPTSEPTSAGTRATRLTLALRFVDPNAALVVEGQQQLPGRMNYMAGSDPARWKTNVATWKAVRYRNLWEGVDGVFRGRNGEIKYDFIVSPGFSPDRVRLSYEGARTLSLDPSGNLLIHTELGTLRDAAPVTYQEIAGRRVEVTSRYVLSGHEIRFAVGPYDSTAPLVIDPGLAYASLLDGMGRRHPPNHP